MGSGEGVKHVILYAALRPGNLTLVECNDGSFRILRDERPIPECRWEAHEVEIAVKAFRALSAKLKDTPTN